MLPYVEHERYDMDIGDLEATLQENTKAYNERQQLLKSLRGDEDKWGRKLDEAQARARDISTNKKYVHDSLDAFSFINKS